MTKKTKTTKTKKAQGSRLGVGEWAIGWNPDSGYTMYMPASATEENAEVPVEALLLFGMMMHAQSDTDWACEQIAWIEAQAEKAEEIDEGKVFDSGESFSA